MKHTIPNSSLSELLFLFLGLRKRQRVVGNSMAPLLKEGDEVLINPRAYRDKTPQVGDVVIAWHPILPKFKIVKRVAYIESNGNCFLVGDNKEESEDSRKFGVISAENILGRVVSRF